MSISETILPEFDHEMANTRKTIERVPNGKFEYKPHDKSFTLGQLASHIVNIPTWTQETLMQDSVDVNPGDGEGFSTPQHNSVEDLLKSFDEAVTRARETIAETTDEQMLQPWSLLNAGETVLTMPRIAVLRSFILNHQIHHRAQLTVYLRLNDVPLPALYGPSADEQAM